MFLLSMPTTGHAYASDQRMQAADSKHIEAVLDRVLFLCFAHPRGPSFFNPIVEMLRSKRQGKHRVEPCVGVWN